MWDSRVTFRILFRHIKAFGFRLQTRNQGPKKPRDTKLYLKITNGSKIGNERVNELGPHPR